MFLVVFDLVIFKAWGDINQLLINGDLLLRILL
ncbi:hypothetical protein Sbal183_2504 [Shewanella baltica OS183]|nr:hypothetical protein Sbal175_1799 [Shewanella baltica BA175]EHQ15397.1 hypothetical protein Sbal183_2504 [Shewanella baltica OS183]